VTALGCALAWALLSPTPTAAVADEVSRLAGHTVSISADGASYTIDDIAGEGAPSVGSVERRGRDLWLIETSGAEWKLRGPLAVPRIAGPHYKVWVVGDADETTRELVASRLGILAPPKRTDSGR
jgi:hypothetical protein